jgi:hypothetical protein
MGDDRQTASWNERVNTALVQKSMERNERLKRYAVACKTVMVVLAEMQAAELACKAAGDLDG